MNFLNTQNYSKKYWLLNLLQMIERLAYWVAILQIPIYIAQKDIPGGLHFEQTTKGLIFFWWALVQNLSPVLWGGYADKIGSKRSILISSLFVVIGYCLLATQREFAPFLAGTVVLGFGLGTFKPALQGWLASELTESNSSTGWGIYVFLVNLAVFFGPPVALYLKAISWQAVFFGSAAIFALIPLLLFFIEYKKTEQIQKSENIIPLLFKTIFTKRIGFFVLIMSGFTMTYMQFYETLPNFIFDWVDTSSIAAHLPAFMQTETPRGTMIAYEWLYNLNSGLIILFVVLMTKLTAKVKITHTLSIGILLAGIGLFVAGFSQSGIFLVLGIVCYTFGEIITNPKFVEYLGRIAPESQKSLYLGVMNISWAIGLAGGGLAGGWIYKHFGEKAHLASLYLESKGITNVSLSQTFNKAMEISGLNHVDLTALLWNSYNPSIIWLPFLMFSLISVVAMYFYSKKY